MAAGVSRGRRVLGEKDRNTIVSVGVGADVINKQASSPSKPRMGDADTATSSPRTGQKRKFDSVGEDGVQDVSQQSSNSGITEPLSTLASLPDAISSCPVYETADETDTSPLDVSVDSQTDDVMQSILDTSLSQPPHSQGEVGADQQDTFFEIHEEMSQQTLDNLHAVSFSQPQQQPNSLLNPSVVLPHLSLAKENSQSSVSMSSLIGFDEKDGSQESVEEAMRQQQQQQQSSTQSIKTEQQQDQDTNASSCRTEEAEKEGEDGSRRAAAMAEKAQTLRTRLQLAYYKVTTNQASTPFSRLAAQRRQQQQASSSARSRLLSPPQLVPASHGRNRHDDSGEWRIARARELAAMQQKPVIRSLNDSEMPLIRPTAFSARWMDDAGEGGRVGFSLAPAAAVPTTPIQTNRRRRVEETGEKEEKEGKDRGGKTHEHGRERERDCDGYDDDDDYGSRFAGLTSSVVKGEAADLLLQLNRASATPGRAQG